MTRSWRAGDDPAQWLEEIADQIEEAAAPVTPIERFDELDRADREQNIKLKRIYATRLLRLLMAQLFIANGFMVAYAWAGKAWNVPDGVIQVWLAATVVQIVSIVLIVTRHLFPDHRS